MKNRPTKKHRTITAAKKEAEARMFRAAAPDGIIEISKAELDSFAAGFGGLRKVLEMGMSMIGAADGVPPPIVAALDTMDAGQPLFLTLHAGEHVWEIIVR